MFKFISNMPIFRRLFIAFTLATVIPGIIVALLGASYIDALNTRSQAVTISFNAQNDATDEQISLNRMNALLQARFAQVFALSGKAIPADDTTMQASTNLANDELLEQEITFDQNLDNYQQAYDISTSDQMADLRNILLSDASNRSIIQEQHTILNLLSQQWATYQTAQDRLLNLLQAPLDSKGNVLPYTPDYSQAYQLLFNANNTYLDLKNSWQTLVKDATIVGTTVTNISGPSFVTPLIGYTIAALLLTILIILGTGAIVNATITQPLRKLVALTRRIATGDTQARAEIHGHDEIYAVAASMNNMLEYIVRLAHQAEERHLNLQLQIEKMVNEVSTIGAGDLTIQAEVTIDELGVLADSFNFMTEELSNLVVRVKSLANEVGYATSTTFERMALLVQNADLQIQQIVSAADKVSDMAISSKNVAERAQILSEIARNASFTAQNGHSAVQQTVAGMERISQNVHETSEKVQVLGDRSREISEIIKVMSSMAQQTNRLALDAAIQAAMAGENGTGFAAVATDIRRLAERSKEQALLINRIVHTVLEDINSVASSMNDTEKETVAGSRLADEADQALHSIFSVVEQQAHEILTINRVVTQHVESSSDVVQIMQTVSDLTRQGNQVTRETAQEMGEIAQLAEELHTSVQVFKVREERVPQLAGASRQGFTGRQASGPISLHGLPKEPSHVPSQPLRREPPRSPSQPLHRNTLLPTERPFQTPPPPFTPVPETPTQPQPRQNYRSRSQEY